MDLGTWKSISAEDYSYIFAQFGGSFAVHPRVVALVATLAKRPVRYMGLLYEDRFVAAVPLWGEHIIATKSALEVYEASHLIDVGDSEVVLPVSEGVKINIPFHARILSCLHSGSILNLEQDNEPYTGAKTLTLARVGAQQHTNETKRRRKRQIRRFQEVGGKFYPSEDFSPDELSNIYTTLYKMRRGHRESPQGEHYLQLVFTELKDMLCGDLLFLNDRFVAMELLYKHHTPRWLFVNGVQRVCDSEFQNYSIGTNLIYHNIEKLEKEADLAGKILRYSFGWNDAPYKALWTIEQPAYRTYRTCSQWRSKEVIMTSKGDGFQEATERNEIQNTDFCDFVDSQTRNKYSVFRVCNHLNTQYRFMRKYVARWLPICSFANQKTKQTEAGAISASSETANVVKSANVLQLEDESMLSAVGGSLDSVLQECSSGSLSANMALFRLICYAPNPETITQALQLAIREANGAKRTRLLDAQSLWQETPNAFELVKTVNQKYSSSLVSADASEPISRVTAAYDEISKLSPIGSVALYSLGRDDLLEMATAEVVDYIRGECLLGSDKSALEIGCGSGRFLAAMAPELLAITGIDISRNMLNYAADRCKNVPNVELICGDGKSFGTLSHGKFDFVVAIDSFPHVVEAGDEIILENMKEIKRVLRSGGRFLIFNFSYRGDDELDRRDIFSLADQFGFKVLRCGDRPFHFWDGAIFDLERLN